MIGVQLARLLEAEQRRVDQRAAGIEDDDLLPGAHRLAVKYGDATAMPAKRRARTIQNLAATRLFVIACDGGEFHSGLVAGSGGGPCRAFEECELNAACAAYGA